MCLLQQIIPIFFTHYVRNVLRDASLAWRSFAFLFSLKVLPLTSAGYLATHSTTAERLWVTHFPEPSDHQSATFATPGTSRNRLNFLTVSHSISHEKNQVVEPSRERDPFETSFPFFHSFLFFVLFQQRFLDQGSFDLPSDPSSPLRTC